MRMAYGANAGDGDDGVAKEVIFADVLVVHDHPEYRHLLGRSISSAMSPKRHLDIRNIEGELLAEHRVESCPSASDKHVTSPSSKQTHEESASYRCPGSSEFCLWPNLLGGRTVPL